MYKRQQEINYNRRHKASLKEALEDSTPVWVSTEGHKEKGVVVTPTGMPRSYLIQTQKGEVRRTRFHLQPHPQEEAKEEEQTQEVQGMKETKEEPAEQPAEPKTREINLRTSPIQTRTRMGTVIKPPDQLYC